MTTTQQPTIVPAGPDGTRLCGVCAHDLAAHDRVGLRYCEATQQSALPRGCICRNVQG